jgi:hypothetical protein
LNGKGISRRSRAIQTMITRSVLNAKLASRQRRPMNGQGLSEPLIQTLAWYELRETLVASITNKEKRKMTIQEKLKETWDAACRHDGIPPGTKFAVFSEDNPHAKQHDKWMGMYLAGERMKKLRVDCATGRVFSL